jgi:hypothetical protein
MSTFQPLLPKTDAEFKGGDAVGQWIEGTSKLFNDLGNSLEFDAGVYGEVNSIPNPWSRPLQFVSAFRNPKYPSRDWLIAQYRGLLTTLALAKNLKLKITATAVRLTDFNQEIFGKCLWDLRPKDKDNILRMDPTNGPWSELYLFELDGVVIGMTSPATLICPTGHFPVSIKNRLSWLEWKTFYLEKEKRQLGFFLDPLSNGLSNKHKEILIPWLQYLKVEVLKEPKDKSLAGLVGTVLQDYITELGGGSQDNSYSRSTDGMPFGVPLGHEPLPALYPAEAIVEKSNVQVIHDEDKNPKDNLYVIDPVNLPGILGRPLHEINVIGSSSLLNFQPSQHDLAQNKFVKPEDFFLPEIYYSSVPGLLPGSWLDEKMKMAQLDKLTILLPLQSFIKDYFSSEYLKKNLNFESTVVDHNPGIKISLTLYLTGAKGNGRPTPHIISQSFVLKKENDLKDDYPAVALWPDLPKKSQIKWQEFFILVSILDKKGKDYSFNINQPTQDAKSTSRRFGNEEYCYWKCCQRPDILEVINRGNEFLGMIPLNGVNPKQGQSDTWVVGVDFGTSFTNVYLRKGSKLEPFKMEPNLLQVTLGLKGSEVALDNIYRHFFIPDAFLPKGNLPPMTTALITQGWPEDKSATAKIMTEARIYYPQLTGDFSEYARTNIKWDNIQYQEPFLAQLVRMISVQAALESVKSIEWAVSYPSAFSSMDLSNYRATWERVLANIEQVSGGKTEGQKHTFYGDGLQTESVAFAKYFADVHKQLIVHTTCVDIGGGTSDLSIWKANQLVHQASVPYAGRNFFHNLLREKIDYFAEVFGFRQGQIENLKKYLKDNGNNFNSIIDLNLRSDGEEEVKDASENYIHGYRINSQKERNRQFRTLLAFAQCGLFYYIGLVQKGLKKEGKIQENYFTSLLLGGNGSRFIHWLSPSGKFSKDSEINELVEGIMLAATELETNPNLLALSEKPKQEACGGLVVEPGGEQLVGIHRKTSDDPFLGEACVINGKKFEADERLTLEDEWNEITEFNVVSTVEIEKYLEVFNKTIKDRKIDEIDQLRDYKNGNVLKITDSFRKPLMENLKKQCLRKEGPKTKFEPDPPFLMVLKAFLEVLAKEW